MSLHILRQSQCNPERFRSFCRQISQSRQNSRKCKLHKKSLIEKIYIYINNVTSPIIDTIIEGTDGLLCLRKTQAMWGKRTGFEAVTTR